jgi:hypothetical protein
MYGCLGRAHAPLSVTMAERIQGLRLVAWPDSVGALRMRKNVFRVALLIPIGIALVLMGARIGWVITLIGAVLLVLEWRTRDDRPLDPVLNARIHEAMKLEKSDPTAAARLLDQAWTEADGREEQEFADLLRRAGSDREAAIELRSRLRGKLKIGQAARRKAEKHALDSPDGADVLKELDRRASDRELQLAQVELYLEKFRDSS